MWFHVRGWRDEGLHAFKGMIGYCMKDNGKEQFDFVHRNVSATDKNEGKLEYPKFAKVNLNNRVSLSHSDILQKARQWAHFQMTKHLDVTLPDTLFHICKSMQYYLDPTWVIPKRSIGMDVRRATYIRKIMMNPHGIEMEDISNHFFDTVSGVSNMRYFESQQIALDHCNEEREVNFVLCHT